MSPLAFSFFFQVDIQILSPNNCFLITIKAHTSVSLKRWRIQVVIRISSARCATLVYLSVCLGISTESVFFLWANIELGTLAFLALWAVKTKRPGEAGLMKTFLIQRLAGLGILAIIIITEINLGRDIVLLVFRTFSLIKLGGFPFQNWVLEIIETMPLEIFFLFLTLQKALPLHLAYFFTPHAFLPLAAFRWGALTLRCLSLISVKKIVLISSTYFLMALVGLLPFTGMQWKVIFLVYSLTLVPLLLLLRAGPRCRGGPGKPEARVSLGWALILGTLAGIPPLPGFFLKLEILIVLLRHLELVAGLVFLLRGVLLIRMYLSILMKNFHEAAWGALGSLHTRHSLGLLAGGVLILFMAWV